MCGGGWKSGSPSPRLIESGGARSNILRIPESSTRFAREANIDSDEPPAREKRFGVRGSTAQTARGSKGLLRPRGSGRAMATCPRCAEELPTGYGSVCPNCGFVVRIPGIVKLGLTLLVAGLMIALVWTVTADALFAGLWNLVDAILVQPLGGGVLVIAAGLVVCAIGGAYLRRAERGTGLPA